MQFVKHYSRQQIKFKKSILTSSLDYATSDNPKVHKEAKRTDYLVKPKAKKQTLNVLCVDTVLNPLKYFFFVMLRHVSQQATFNSEDLTFLYES